MTSQLSPAWQRKSSQESRLEKLGSQLLSDEPTTRSDDGRRRIIPFLLDSPSQNWVPHDLCQVLVKRGHGSKICQLDETVADSTRLREVPGSGPHEADYCLVPLTSPQPILSHDFDHVVLLVPSTLEGVRAAYQRIKLLSEKKPREFGIVLVGPRDQHAAWRFFRKLAVGTLRYLDIPLLNLGFLPEQVTPEHGPADHHRKNFLARISERLMSSEFYSDCQAIRKTS